MYSYAYIYILYVPQYTYIYILVDCFTCQLKLSKVLILLQKSVLKELVCCS